jgi:mono/diheme cytochrome c family protein
MRTCRILVVSSLLLAGMLSAATGQVRTTEQGRQKEIRRMPIKYIEPTSGVQMFKSYCAACHGPEGKGDGPAAEFLKKTPPDLSKLAQRNNGKYPADHVVKSGTPIAK